VNGSVSRQSLHAVQEKVFATDSTRPSKHESVQVAVRASPRFFLRNGAPLYNHFVVPRSISIRSGDVFQAYLLAQYEQGYLGQSGLNVDRQEFAPL
jgi:hypothetical protein